MILIIVVCYTYSIHVSIAMNPILTSDDKNSLKCIEGNDTNFELPCPEEFKDSRFKKLFGGKYIMRDGVMVNGQKYQMNENETLITLKECNEDDEGTYVWMCGRSNVNRQYHLEVYKLTNSSLECSVGENISFQLSCPQELDSCTFTKVEHKEYILINGILNNTRYEFNEDKSNLTLKKCHEDDAGTYHFICGKCKEIMQFNLEISKPSPARKPLLLLLLLLLILPIALVALLTILWFRKNKRKKISNDHPLQISLEKIPPQEQEQSNSKAPPATNPSLLLLLLLLIVPIAMSILPMIL